MRREPHHLIFSADKEENAQAHVPCMKCGAPVGQPCKDAFRQKVHPERLDDYTQWVKAYRDHYRAKEVA